MDSSGSVILQDDNPIDQLFMSISKDMFYVQQAKDNGIDLTNTDDPQTQLYLHQIMQAALNPE